MPRPAAGSCRDPRPGAATGWCPTPSSSGRAGPTGCTTGCASSATTRRAAGGSSSGWHRERTGACAPQRAPASEERSVPRERTGDVVSGPADPPGQAPYPVDPVEGGGPVEEPVPVPPRQRRAWAIDTTPLRNPHYRRLFWGVAATLLGRSEEHTSELQSR